MLNLPNQRALSTNQIFTRIKSSPFGFFFLILIKKKPQNFSVICLGVMKVINNEKLKLSCKDC